MFHCASAMGMQENLTSMINLNGPDHWYMYKQNLLLLMLRLMQGHAQLFFESIITQKWLPIRHYTMHSVLTLTTKLMGL